MKPHLGVNIDHIATLRQLRGTPYPNILTAAQLAEAGGAQQITVHLREDRRHIQEKDVRLLRENLKVPLNLEMAAAKPIIELALEILPEWACLVPEKRKELTTEGGLNIVNNPRPVSKAIEKLKGAGILVSCFIEPSIQAVRLSKEFGADAIEFHTGLFCLATQGAFGGRSAKRAETELARLEKAARYGQKTGLRVHAGHGIDYENINKIVALSGVGGLPLITEYNIGHSIICRAALFGLEKAVREMVDLIAGDPTLTLP